jgi:hypothetical protein
MPEQIMENIESENDNEMSEKLKSFFSKYDEKIINFINESPYKYEISTNIGVWRKKHYNEALKDAQQGFGENILQACNDYPELSKEIKKLLELKDDQVLNSGMIEHLIIKDNYPSKFEHLIKEIESGSIEKAA